MKEIPLTHGKIALVDDADYALVSKHRWHYVGIGNNWYARTTIFVQGVGRKVRMHRLILDAPDGVLVDHKDGDGTNNQRHNLRVASNSQNKMNGRRSAHKLKGVHARKGGLKWEARITHAGKQAHIGEYLSTIEAAFAYDRKARELFGEFACPNFHPDYEGAYYERRSMND